MILGMPSPSSFLLAFAAACLLSASAANAPITDSYFADTLYPALEQAQCRLCHNDNGVASGTSLHFPSTEASNAELTAFGLGLARLVKRGAPDESPLWQKPTQRISHTGGERIPRQNEIKNLCIFLQED
jgi:hypothetical protein